MKPAIVELLAKDLNHQGGVFCPNPLAQMKTWDTHPKGYVDVGKSGKDRRRGRQSARHDHLLVF